MNLKANPVLIEDKGLSEEIETKLNVVYRKLEKVLLCPEDYEDPVETIESLEFELQELWGFDKSRERHSYWYRVKGCKCPKMDNSDPLYGGRRIINSECFWHGSM